jgi:hypothetical protein
LLILFSKIVKTASKCVFTHKVEAAEVAFVQANGKLVFANKAVEDLKKLMPGVDLIKDPPVMMPVIEHTVSLNRIGAKVPSAAIERGWGAGCTAYVSGATRNPKQRKTKGSNEAKSGQLLGRSASP